MLKKSKKVLIIDFYLSVTRVAYIRASPKTSKLFDFDCHIATGEQSDTSSQKIAFIKSFCRRNAIKNKDVIMNMSSSDSVVVKYLDLQNLSKREILNAAKIELIDHVPFDLETAFVGYQSVDIEAKGESGDVKTGSVFIAVKKETMESCLSILAQCELNVIRVTNGFFNYANILKHLSGVPSVVAVLDIGYQESIFGIYVNNRLVVSRCFSLGAKNSIGDLEEKKLDTSPAEEVALQSHMQKIFLSQLDVVIRQLRLSFEYFSTTFHRERPSLLYVSGFGANIMSIEQYLQQEMDMNVKLLPIPPDIEFKIKKHKKTSGIVAGIHDHVINNVIGAVLPNENPLNLIEADIAIRKIEAKIKRYFILIVFLMGGITFFSSLIVEADIQKNKNSLRYNEEYWQNIKVIDQVNQRRTLKKDFVEAFRAQQYPVEELIKIISMLMPGNISLNHINYSQEDCRFTFEGEIFGSGDRQTILSNFLSQLKKTALFTQLKRLTFKDGVKSATFKVLCDINPNIKNDTTN